MSSSLKDDVKVVSDKNKEVRERTKVPTIRADVTVAHNYSSQSLNSTEFAKEKLRQMLAEVSLWFFLYDCMILGKMDFFMIKK